MFRLVLLVERRHMPRQTWTC